MRYGLHMLTVFVLLAVGSTSVQAEGRPARVVPFSEFMSDNARFLTFQSTLQSTEFATSAAFVDPVDAAKAIGDRLTDLQADVTEDNAGNGAVDGDNQDGGWDFETTGDTEHMGPGGKSFENLYGPIARGLVEAAIFTGDARLMTASGDVFAGISQAGTGALGRYYYRTWNADLMTPYIRYADAAGLPALKDTAKARHDTELAGFGGAGGRALVVRNGRWGQGIIGLWPWDIHLLTLDSKALGVAFPGDVAIYDAEMDSVSQVIQDDMNGLLGVDMWDPTDFLQDFHQISLTGALRAFTCSPRVDDDGLATDMRDSLVAGQLANGSWGISFGGTFFPDDTQTTSYAVMALIEYADKFGPDDVAVAAARAGNLFILSVTDGAGIVTAGSEFSESSGEAITALLAGSLKLGIESANILSDCVVAGSNLFSVDVTILDVTPDPTDVQAMSIEFAFDDSELDLLSITVPGGSIWGASFVDFTATGAGTGQIDVSSLLFGGISAGIGGVVCTLNFERKIGAVGVLDYSIVSAEIRDPDNSPIAACLTEAEGSARFILGDFTTTLVGSSTDCGPPGFGLPDGDVDVFDLGVFSSHFGAIDPAAEYCCIIDIGPTTTNFIFGEPTIDGAIDFEDLVIFSISFGFSTIGGYLAPAPGDLTDQVTNVRLVPMSAGSELLVDVVLNPAVAVQAMHAILDYDPSQLRFLGAERSGMTTGENNFLAVIPGDGIDLNLAALGVGNAWDEQGTVATLRFERLSEATSSIGFTKLDLRDSYNRQLPSAGEKLDLDGSVPAITAQTVNFLSPIQPNPIAIGSGGAVIRFGSRVAQNVELSIYSADGRVIRSLVSGSVGAGEHTVTWNGRDASGSRVSSGIYFARYQTPDYQTTIKFTVIR